METTIMGYKGIIGNILGYIGIMEKKMETTIMGYKGIIENILGLYRDNGKENGNYHTGL